MALEAWFAAARGSGAARIVLTEVARALGDAVGDPERVVREGFARRHLRVERRLERVPLSSGLAGAALIHDGVVARDELTWIAIRLAYDDDPAVGVAHARYEVALPDGTKRSGRLDRDGNARLDNIVPGMCEVVFPDYDKRKGAPPARIPPGKGHTPRRGKTEAPPAPPPSPGNGGEAMSCRAVRLLPEGRKRGPSDDSLQVVATASQRASFETPLLKNLNAQSAARDALKNWTTVHHALARGGLGGGRKAIKKWDESKSAKGSTERAEGSARSPNPLTWEAQLRAITERFWGGEAKLNVIAEVDGPASHHAHGRLTIDGRPDPDYMVSSASTTLSLAWSGSGPTDERASPTRHALAVTGCAGDEKRLEVEVFPSDQRLVSVGVDATATPTGHWYLGVERFLSNLAGTSLEASWGIEGKVEYFEGWREEESSWRVAFWREGALRFLPRFEGKAEVSILAMVTRVPPSFLKYAADVGVVVSLSVSFNASAEFASKTFPGAAETPVHPFTGSLGGSGELGAGIYGRVGSENVIGASITGSLLASASISGRLRYQSRRVTATWEGKVGEVRGTVKVLSRALVWKSERSWEVKLCDGVSGSSHEPVVLFDFSK